jgi:hypothetical protein
MGLKEAKSMVLSPTFSAKYHLANGRGLLEFGPDTELNLPKTLADKVYHHAV